MINISVLTPDKEIFLGDIKSVKVPGVQGQFQVLKNHAPIVSALSGGDVFIVTAEGKHQYFDAEASALKTIEDEGREVQFTIERGFIEVLNNKVSLLVEGVKEVKVKENK